MTFLQIFVLAVIQGLTEFLPVSSSGHLALVPMLAHWPDQGQSVDVSVHIGTLGAVLLYFWRDVWAMLRGLGRAVRGKKDPGARMAIHLILATIPAVIAGLAMKKLLGEDYFRSMAVIGWTMLIWGMVLGLADMLCMRVKRLDHMPLKEAMLIGCAQALALIPGTSRSGITMTAARAMGYERSEAARFSMLLSIPTILGAGILAVKDILESPVPGMLNEVLTGMVISFVTGLLAITIMMGWLKRASFVPFVVYRVALGLFLLAISYGVITLGGAPT